MCLRVWPARQVPGLPAVILIQNAHQKKRSRRRRLVIQIASEIREMVKGKKDNKKTVTKQQTSYENPTGARGRDRKKEGDISCRSLKEKRQKRLYASDRSFS